MVNTELAWNSKNLITCVNGLNACVVSKLHVYWNWSVLGLVALGHAMSLVHHLTNQFESNRNKLLRIWTRSIECKWNSKLHSTTAIPQFAPTHIRRGFYMLFNPHIWNLSFSKLARTLFSDTFSRWPWRICWSSLFVCLSLRCCTPSSPGHGAYGSAALPNRPRTSLLECRFSHWPHCPWSDIAPLLIHCENCRWVWSAIYDIINGFIPR